MIEIIKIKNLLSQVNTKVTSYDKVAKVTGEKFNIFSVLDIEHYENSTHSKFIGHLLNPKGQHGFGNKFLELFIKEIGAKEHLDTKTAQSKLEHSIGKKIINRNYEMKSKGGRIDIYLWDLKGKTISIENKIYAVDQEKQLVRYYNHNQANNLVFYLTLNGIDTNEYSKGTLIADIDNKYEKSDFYCISYCSTILKWLEECQKEASESPTLRETIKQYRNLIKKLTNQNINSDMNKEISKLILDDPKSTEVIINTVNGIRNDINDKLDELVAKGIENLKTLNGKLNEINSAYHVKIAKRFKYQNREIVNFVLYLNETNLTDDEIAFTFEFSNYDFGIKLIGWSHNGDVKPMILNEFSEELRRQYPHTIDENYFDEIYNNLSELIIKVAKYLNENKEQY